MRKAFVVVHLWVGLVASFFLVAIAVSGAIIAFEGELNRAVHPELTRVQVTGDPLPWQTVKDRVEAATPGWKVNRFYFGDAPDQSTYSRLRAVKGGKTRQVYIDQYTAKVLGSTEDGSDWIIKVHDLHVNFLGGKVGNWIVVLSSWALLILSSTGIYLWWPRKVMRVRSGRRLPQVNADVHHAVGFWTSWAMLLFAVTGLGLHYQTGKLLNLLDDKASAQRIAGHGTSIDQMMQTARETIPGAEIPRILLSEKTGQPVFVYMRFPEDKTPAGRSYVTFDAQTGAVLTHGSSRDAPLLKTALVQYTREIHTGTLFGLPSKILVALLALMLPVLAITGPLLWLNKRRAAARGRRALAERDAARAAARTAAQAPQLVGTE